MAEVALKIMLVGAPQCGKTLFARAIAEQPVFQGEYQPTAAVRIQEIARTVGVDRVKVQLWDCSGSPQYSAYWGILSKSIDGIILVIDPQHPEQEKELEALYMNFAQPHSLTIKQCLVMALQVVKEGAYGLVGFNGLQGKLSKLHQTQVSINPASPQTGIQESYAALDKLLAACWNHKKDTLEQQVMSDGHPQPGPPAAEQIEG